jgi:thymidylate synthase ThyX
MQSSVKLIACTQGAGELIGKSAQEVISYVARVSNPNNQLNFDTAAGLLRYCIKHQHWSIFETSYMTLEINTTRAIAAQILRHRSFCFQEFCMAGSTNVYFDAPESVETLENLYEEWSKGGDQRNTIRDMHVKIFDRDSSTFKTSHIKEVFITGLKDIFEVTLENGKVIRCTKEHKVLTTGGFKSLEDHLRLKLIDDVVTINYEYIGCDESGYLSWSKVKIVKYLGKEMTYDLEIDHKSHNYVADGVVVHNSQRYADTKLLSDKPEPPDLRRQDTKNRQNSIDDLGDFVKLTLQDEISKYFERGQVLYNSLLDKGIAAECARFVLPLATPTRIYMTGSCRSWITYIALREKNGTQKEHMEIAKQCKDVFGQQFPDAYEALGGNVVWEI